MTLLRKIHLSFAVVVLLMLIVGGTGIYGLRQTNDGYEDEFGADVAQAAAAQGFQSAVRGLSSSFRGLILFPDKADVYLPRIASALDDVVKRSKVLTELTANTSEADTAAELAGEASTQVDIIKQSRDALVAGDNARALSLSRGNIDRVFKLADGADEIVASENEQVLKRKAELAAATNRFIVFLIVLLVVSIGLAIGTVILLSRSLTKSISQMMLTLSTSSAELLAVSSQVAASSTQTAASIVETTTTVSEIKQSASVAFEQAALVKESAAEMSRIVRAGRQSVEETVAAIEGMGEQIGIATESIARLSEQAAAISDITASVKDLADQSNLLSVNAAIEATKAGEQGKGFLVVAQEVRNLAAESKQAVAQARGVLADVQKAITSVVMATEVGSKSIERGAIQSRESGAVIEQLAENVDAAGVMFRQTAAAVEQQLAGLDQINSAMQAISEASSQNVAGSQQVASEAQHLREVAVEIETLLV